MNPYTIRRSEITSRVRLKALIVYSEIQNERNQSNFGGYHRSQM